MPRCSYRGLRVYSYAFLFVTTSAMYIISTVYWVVETVTLLQTLYLPSEYANQSESSLIHKSLTLTICLGLNVRYRLKNLFCPQPDPYAQGLLWRRDHLVANVCTVERQQMDPMDFRVGLCCDHGYVYQ